MLFLRKNKYTINQLIDKNKSSSLPSDPPIDSLTAAMKRQVFLERVALCTFSNQKGSLTIETAMVLPIFLFLCLSMIFFIQIFSIHGEVQGALYRASREFSENMPLLANNEEQESTGNGVLLRVLCIASVRQKVMNYTEEVLQGNGCLVGGKSSFEFLNTTVKDDMVDVIVSYRVKLPYAFGIEASFPIVQRCRIRAWTGRSGGIKEDNPEGMVYITENGSAYHKSAGCTHLKLSIRSIAATELQAARNNNGGKYKPCEKCAKKGLAGNHVYITKEGDRYHNSIGCSGLKRSVRKVSKTEVTGKSACMRCYK